MTAEVITVSPVALGSLRLKVSAPRGEGPLPIILFSHGYGSSFRAYGPLTDYWAAHGFAVVQPTHLDSRVVALSPTDPRRPHLWRARVEDMKQILDSLTEIESTVPEVRDRLDHSRTAAAGHSFGGQTTALLLGARVLDPRTGRGEDLSDARVKAGVLLATAGRGGTDLKPEAAAQFPWLNPSFEGMTTPALVVAGDADKSPLTTRGPDWSADPYWLSPGNTSLLTLFGGEHSLGGIPGYEAAETTDEDPARVAAVQRLTWAYLRSVLYPADPAWQEAQTTLTKAVGRLESKQAAATR